MHFHAYPVTTALRDCNCRLIRPGSNGHRRTETRALHKPSLARKRNEKRKYDFFLSWKIKHLNYFIWAAHPCAARFRTSCKSLKTCPRELRVCLEIMESRLRKWEVSSFLRKFSLNGLRLALSLQKKTTVFASLPGIFIIQKRLWF